jgi:predicted site-specific integrase-resolvase
MTASGPMTAHNMDGDLLTRQQVAYLFGETSAKVATWARRGRLPEVRDAAGKPRYRRADVQTLLRARAGRRWPR